MGQHETWYDHWGQVSDPIQFWWWSLDSIPAGSAASLTDAFRSDPTFIPDVAGDYMFSLGVSDGIDWSQRDGETLSVTINLPPTATIFASVIDGTVPLDVLFDVDPGLPVKGVSRQYSGWGSDLLIERWEKEHKKTAQYLRLEEMEHHERVI